MLSPKLLNLGHLLAQETLGWSRPFGFTTELACMCCRLRPQVRAEPLALIKSSRPSCHDMKLPLG